MSFGLRKIYYAMPEILEHLESTTRRETRSSNHPATSEANGLQPSAQVETEVQLLAVQADILQAAR